MKDLYLKIIESIDEGIYFVDQNRTIKYWNNAASLISGYSKEEIINVKCPNSGLNHIDIEGNPLCNLGCPLFKTLSDGKKREHQVFLRHKDGYRVPLTVKVFPIYEDGKIVGAFELFKKTSIEVYQDDLVDSLTKIATTDSLTGLNNRRMVDNYLDYKLSEFNKFNKIFGLIYLDIDNFSLINNTYGHDVGDLVLKNVSQSLKALTTSSDFISRYGGEEFIIIYDNTNFNDLTFKAEAIRALVESTITRTNNKTLRVTISLGATTVRNNDTITSIIKRADDLLYKSKNSGKNKVTIE